MSFEDQPALLASTVAVSLTPCPPERHSLTSIEEATSVRRIGSIRSPTFPGNLLPRLILGLCALLVLTCLVLIVYSRLLLSTDERAPSGFLDCAGVPCFRALTPGQTSWAEALAAFDGRSIIVGDTAYAKIALFPSADGNMLAAILLDQPLDRSITVGMMMLRYGTPACVNVYQNPGTLTLHFGSVHVLTRLVNNNFSAFTRVLAIVLGNPDDDSEPASHGCNLTLPDGQGKQRSQRPWRGFASIEHYLSETER